MWRREDHGLGGSRRSPRASFLWDSKRTTSPSLRTERNASGRSSSGDSKPSSGAGWRTDAGPIPKWPLFPANISTAGHPSGPTAGRCSSTRAVRFPIRVPAKRTSSTSGIRTGRTRAGEPRPVGPPINGEENAAYPSVTKDGTLYISKRFSDKSEKICRSALVDGKYQKLEVLPAVINKTNDNYHAFISPDETYLIKPYYGLKDSIGVGWNYYVSFRKPDGGWGELINLGPSVNSERCGGTPSLSPDGKYLFYQAWTESPDGWAHDRRYTLRELIQKEILIPAGYTNYNIYWVETTIIDALKPKAH